MKRHTMLNPGGVDDYSTANQPIAPHCFSWTAHGYLRQQITTYDTPKFDKFCWL